MLPISVIAAGIILASAALADNSTVAADTYTSSDLGISFALNVPNDSDDLYFSLRGPGDGTWLAIGLGSNKMENALMLIAYPTSNGSYVTVSPRLGKGHTEPGVAPNVTVELLAGSGVQTNTTNNTLAVNARCINCRSWDGGLIDPESSAEEMIFAYGAYVWHPDSVNADLRMHGTYGVFAMDLIAATGPGGVPEITGDDVKSIQASISSSHELASPIHAIIMILTFIGFMPLGTLLLRVMGWVKLHAINQTLASLLGLIGAGLGIYCSTLYNRSKKFNTGHQIFGIIIIVAMLVQLVLGMMHHRIHKKTEQTTKIAPVHIWLGRFVIVGGTVNAFFGFPLALASHYDIALGVIVLLVAIPTFLILLYKARRTARKAREVIEVNRAGAESPKLFASEAFGTNIRMETMGNPSHYAQPIVEPWSRV